MKKVLLYLIVVAILLSCGGRSYGTESNNPQYETQPNHIEVLYFYGQKRCVTCRAIETNTVGLLDSLYSSEIKEGKITFRTIDISKKENKKIADKYEVSWSSLILNMHKDGSETVDDLTSFGFSNARNHPQEFKDSLRRKIDNLLERL